jgi:hypothetical protein
MNGPQLCRPHAMFHDVSRKAAFKQLAPCHDAVLFGCDLEDDPIGAGLRRRDYRDGGTWSSRAFVRSHLILSRLSRKQDCPKAGASPWPVGSMKAAIGPAAHALKCSREPGRA